MAATNVNMNNYCITPPFIQAGIPPLLMLTMTKDHTMFYKAYTDTVDLDASGVIDNTYKDSIDYYGYFNPNKCYGDSRTGFTASGDASGAHNHYCSGAWSGNFLNWATMTRIDLLRKALYGGKRSTDTAGSPGSTILERARLPRDSHSWAKWYTGSDLSQLTPAGSNTAITMCNTTKTSGGDPLMMVVWGNAANGPSGPNNTAGGYHPYAAATEGQQCVTKYDGGANLCSSTSCEYVVRVAVCTSATSDPNCKQYGTNYKPAGLLEKVGINKDNNAVQMYFGLITGSYKKNKSGGVLRSNLRDITKEINSADGTVSSSSKIIKTLDMFEIKNYNYDSGSYNDCGLAATFNEGDCEDWGNPVGEMYYEALRYFMGKAVATSQYSFSGGDDNFSGMPNDTGSWKNPYVDTGVCSDSASCPVCAKPYILSLSDANPSFDSDQLPGSNWSGSLSPDDTGLNVKTLITNSNINSVELSGVSQVFVGQSGSTSDKLCSAKTADFGSIRGICPGEPTMEGSFYIAGLAHWAHTTGFIPSGLSGETYRKKVTTYVVATQSNVQNMVFSAGGRNVNLIPTFYVKDNDGRGEIADFRVLMTPSITCPTGVNNDWFDGAVTNTTYKNTKNDCQYEHDTNGYQYGYEIAYDDSIAGNDYDLDVRYRIYVKISGSTITLKTKGVYANAGYEDRPGYLIYGTGSGDGEYQELKCGFGGTTCQTYCNNTSCPSNSSNTGMSYVERVFTVSGTSAAFLKNPLWYAAKYGGFKDTDGNHYPDVTAKWDSNGDGLPDTYFDATNPLLLEQQLLNAFLDIMSQASSGTAVSMLTSSEGSGAILLQAAFYPTRTFITPPSGAKTDIQWTSELQNLWYYLDPTLNSSTIREDTFPPTGSQDHILNIDTSTGGSGDNILHFNFDTATNKTMVYVYSPTGTFIKQVPFEDLNTSLWRAGYNLWSLAASSRNIKTNTGAGLISFSYANAGSGSNLRKYLQTANDTDTQNLISYVTGVDITSTYPGSSPAKPYRSRTVSIDVNSNNAIDSGETNVWKLGDIVTSTPRVQPDVRLNTYHFAPPQGYNDTTYSTFVSTTDYKNRGTVYTGANDGMLHAFRLGKLRQTWTHQAPTQIARLSGSGLGNEDWAFIPMNALPYLQYLGNPNYGHLYYVDLPVTLVDASLGGSATDVKSTDGSSWRTVLIGGMGLGGASNKSDDSCSTATACVKTPWTSDDTNKSIGLSSYFALDVTNVNVYNPTGYSFMWEFTDPDLGYSTTGPAIVRIGDKTQNGKWFAVFASGPTGPIDTSSKQFKGSSNQNLKIYVVDLKTGTLATTPIDTGKTNAFAGSLRNAALDADKWSPASAGHYSDDVVYIGYSQCTSFTSGSCTNWDGGVLRLTTKEDPNPSNWTVSTVLSGTGPVTTAIAKLQDRTNHNLWLYFGSGRYYYKTATGTDDADAQRKLYGIREPCYNTTNLPGDRFDPACTQAGSASDDRTTFTGTCSDNPSNSCNSGAGGMTNCATGAQCVVPASSAGWYIRLLCSATDSCSWGTAPAGYKAERVVTETLAAYNGAVFFTTFSPTTDICGFGGNTYLWAVGYNTGGMAPLNSLLGTAIIQVSTGAIAEQQLSSVFTQSGGRRTMPTTGMPPVSGSGAAVTIPPRPLQKYMHIKEQ
jgi:type IV pilus assembly protein PilY1